VVSAATVSLPSSPIAVAQEEKKEDEETEEERKRTRSALWRCWQRSKS